MEKEKINAEDIILNFSMDEMAKSFIEDVGSVSDQLDNGEPMNTKNLIAFILGIFVGVIMFMILRGSL